MNIRYPIYEGVYRILTVKVQSVHRHNGARFGCKSAESAGIFV